VDSGYENKVTSRWASKVHPYFVMMLSLLSKPIEYDSAIHEISFFFDISKDQAKDFLDMLYNKKSETVLDYDGLKNMFPRNVVINAKEAFRPIKEYNPEDFNFKELDINTIRPFTTPLTLVLMLTNKCITDCIYCYADKRTKLANLPIEYVSKLIDDANDNNIVDFMVTGGEFFLYEKWDLLLDKLFLCNYKIDLVSTKVPITEKTIIKFKKYNIRLQMSIDSLDSGELQNILKVNDKYANKIKETMFLLNKYGVDCQVATVLTTHNKNIHDLQELYAFLSQFSNINRWEIRVAFKSLYSKENFDSIKILREDITTIASWIEKIKEQTKLNILWSPDNDDTYFRSNDGSKEFIGARCSANMTNLFILPDGKVTICEQLYWKEKYIIGDITKQGLKEIWNSTKALELLSPKQKNVTTKSPCSICKIYDECISYANKCIADVIKAYGDENSDYPDPRCGKAPKFINNLFHS
jgi:radical SAM protein with 4Fe4S-binding SPASM domain